MVKMKIKALCERHGIDVDVITCLAPEIPSRCAFHKLDLIVATVDAPPGIDVPFLRGIPYLTGIGAEELDEQVIEILTRE
jgi:PTS system galactitol-specific IIB component